MPCCGGTELIPFVWALPVVFANFASTTKDCDHMKQRRKPPQERRQLLERLNKQVLEEVRVPGLKDNEMLEGIASVEVDEDGVVTF